MKQKTHRVSVLNSNTKGLRVLVLDPNEKRSVEFEARTELDPHLQRVNVFYVSHLAEARDLAKGKQLEVAIFPESLGPVDFVSIQNDLKNANPNIKMVPLVDNPTLSQYRESKQIGGILDYGSSQTLMKYETIRDLIVHVARLFSKDISFEDQFNQLKHLQRALLIKDHDREEVKAKSATVCAEFTKYYDLSSQETVNVILAEMIYLPELSMKDYHHLLQDEKSFEILEILEQTATPKIPNSKPQSANGFIVTAAYAFAALLAQQKSLKEIIEVFHRRPHYLLHPALRVVSQYVLTSTFEFVSDSTTQRRVK